MADIGLVGCKAHICLYYRLLAHLTWLPGEWGLISQIRWGEAMRLGPALSDSPPSGSTRNGAINALYALPHPNGSAVLVPQPANMGC